VDGAFNGVGVGKEFPSGVVGTLNFKLQHDSRKAFFDILSVNVRLQRLARPREQIADGEAWCGFCLCLPAVYDLPCLC